MTTMEASPSIASVIAMKVATKLANRSKGKERAQTWMQALSRFVLHVAGFACLTYAGFTWSIMAGLIIAGLSCFAMSTLFTTSNTPTESGPPRNPGDHLSRR
jgi:fatty acid desaturase